MKLSINTSRTIENIGSIFTNSEKVISELIQNARRAGATTVNITETLSDTGIKTICVQDDGAGIQNFNALFSLSDSAWSDNITAQDQPFGIGFFSTFFAAKKVKIESQGKEMLIDCADAIAMREFDEPVASTTSPANGTRITLIDTNVPDLVFVKKIARYSHITITVNGELMDNALCFEKLSKIFPVVQTPYGKLVLVNEFSDDIKFVAQDTLISLNNRHCDHNRKMNVLFIDTAVVKVRMPDRDTIINQEEFLAEFSAYTKNLYKEKLAEKRLEINSDKHFVEVYFDSIEKYDLTLLNNIDYLPSKAFLVTQQPAVVDSDYYYLEQNYGEALCKTDLANRIILKDSISLYNGDNPIVATFCHSLNICALSCKLDKEHWVNAHLTQIDVDDLMVELVNPVSFNVSNMNYYYQEFKAIAADAVIITHKKTGISVTSNKKNQLFNALKVFKHEDYILNDELDNAPVTYSNGEEFDLSDVSCIILKSAADLEPLLIQMDTYTYNEVFNQDLINEDVNSLILQLRAATNDDPCEVLSDLIGKLPSVIVESLQGKTLTVCFENNRAIFKAV